MTADFWFYYNIAYGFYWFMIGLSISMSVYQMFGTRRRSKEHKNAIRELKEAREAFWDMRERMAKTTDPWMQHAIAMEDPWKGTSNERA